MTRDVLLPTGDLVVTRAVGARTGVWVRRAAAHGAASVLTEHRGPRSTSVVPATAAPYLGTLLDPAMFDLGRLAKAPAGRVPLRISFSGKAPAVPGVTVTKTSAGALSGYVTATSARRFGAALAAVYAKDARAGFPARRTLFGATRITVDLAGGGGVTPRYPMRTVIIKGVDVHGAASQAAFVDVVAVDDMSRWVGFSFLVDGEARVSVPVGTYTFAVTSFDDVDASGDLLSARLQVIDGVVVSGQDQVVAADERRATSRLRARTPRPADVQDATLTWTRTDAAGNGSFSGGVGAGSVPMLVAPTPAATVGTLTSSASFVLTGVPGRGDPYRYDAAFGQRPGIPAGQTYTVAQRETQTVEGVYDVDRVPRTGGLARGVLNPPEGGFFAVAPALPIPSRQTEYVRGEKGAVRWDTLFASPDPAANPFADLVDGGPRLLRPRSTVTEVWLRGPDLPRVYVVTDGVPALFGEIDCPACRTPGTLRLFLDPAQDVTPGHSVAVFAREDGVPVARLQVLADGVTLVDDTDVSGVEVPVGAAAKTYRVVLGLDRVPSLAMLSTTTRTEYGFRSAAPGRTDLPSGWACSLDAAAGTPPPCAVLPLLQARVDLPVSPVGSVPIGRSTIRLSLDHIEGAARTPVTAGTVEVRYPGGTWTRLRAERLRAGVYAATLRPGPDHAGDPVDLRVGGTDSAGGSILQTATKAFVVSGS